MRCKSLHSGWLCALAAAMLLVAPARSLGLDGPFLAENGPYEEGVHYTVRWNELEEPEVTIQQPSVPEWGPYDFECYYKLGENIIWWNIAGFSAGPWLVGDVELMVRSSNPQQRPWGAANVKALQVENENVHLTIKDFKIYDYLGDPTTPEIYAYAIDGPFYAMGLLRNLHVAHLSGDFTLEYNYADIEVTESETHNANIWLQVFDPVNPHDLTIAGSLAGTLKLGAYEQTTPANGTVTIAGDVQNVSVLTEGGISGQVNIGQSLLGSFQILHAWSEPPTRPAVVLGHLVGELMFSDPGYPQDLNDTLWLQVGNIAAGAVVELVQNIGETGALKITGDPNDPNAPLVNGSVVVDHDLVGNLEIDGTVAPSGLVEVAGAVGGYPSPGGHMHLSELQGTAHVGQYIGAGGGVEVTGPTSGTVDVDGQLRGYVHLQDLSGTVDVAGYMGDNDPNVPLALFPGHIRVYGGLKSAAKIWVHTMFPGGILMGPTSYICVDFDGFTEGDDWPMTASVVFGPAEDYVYHGNTPSVHIWHTSRIHGDVDNTRNDRVNPYYPDFTDINPFVLALSNPVQFSLTYPGLADTDGTVYTGGGILYKADCNCDGSVNFADINPFVALVGGTCDPNCPDCPGGDGPMGGDSPMGGGEPLSPEQMAAELAANVAPELYDNLLFVVAGAIEAAPDEETQAYWEAVYAALTQ